MRLLKVTCLIALRQSPYRFALYDYIQQSLSYAWFDVFGMHDLFATLLTRKKIRRGNFGV